MRANKVMLSGLAWLLLCPQWAAAQVEISFAVMGTGGGAMTNAVHAIHGTAGQAAVGPVANDEYSASGGYWYQEEEIAASVDQGIVPPPERFALSSAPNPARGFMLLRYAVPRESRVSVHLYDVSGRRVLTLVEGNCLPGYHETSLLAGQLPSGIYFAGMLAPGFKSVQRLVLLR